MLKVTSNHNKSRELEYHRLRTHGVIISTLGLLLFVESIMMMLEVERIKQSNHILLAKYEKELQILTVWNVIITVFLATYILATTMKNCLHYPDYLRNAQSVQSDDNPFNYDHYYHDNNYRECAKMEKFLLFFLDFLYIVYMLGLSYIMIKFNSEVELGRLGRLGPLGPLGPVTFHFSLDQLTDFRQLIVVHLIGFSIYLVYVNWIIFDFKCKHKCSCDEAFNARYSRCSGFAHFDDFGDSAHHEEKKPLLAVATASA